MTGAANDSPDDRQELSGESEQPFQFELKVRVSKSAAWMMGGLALGNIDRLIPLLEALHR